MPFEGFLGLKRGWSSTGVGGSWAVPSANRDLRAFLALFLSEKAGLEMENLKVRVEKH